MLRIIALKSDILFDQDSFLFRKNALVKNNALFLLWIAIFEPRVLVNDNLTNHPCLTMPRNRTIKIIQTTFLRYQDPIGGSSWLQF